MNLQDWWNARVRAGEQQAARNTAAARQRGVAAARSLRELTDDELIAQTPAQSTLSRPVQQMEMQRRLKDSIEALTKETGRARWWALWGSVAIGALTVVLVVLTIVIALKA